MEPSPAQREPPSERGVARIPEWTSASQVGAEKAGPGRTAARLLHEGDYDIA
jgi:hypothetical protein